MKILRKEVFYKTDQPVRNGDEFYEIILVKICASNLESFEVRTFHGFAGAVPEEAEKVESFQALEKAEGEFTAVTGAMGESGFCLYDSLIHGPDKPI